MRNPTTINISGPAAQYRLPVATDCGDHDDDEGECSEQPKPPRRRREPSSSGQEFDRHRGLCALRGSGNEARSDRDAGEHHTGDRERVG